MGFFKQLLRVFWIYNRTFEVIEVKRGCLAGFFLWSWAPCLWSLSLKAPGPHVCLSRLRTQSTPGLLRTSEAGSVCVNVRGRDTALHCVTRVTRPRLQLRHRSPGDWAAAASLGRLSRLVPGTRPRSGDTGYAGTSAHTETRSPAPAAEASGGAGHGMAAPVAPSARLNQGEINSQNLQKQKRL